LTTFETKKPTSKVTKHYKKADIIPEKLSPSGAHKGDLQERSRGIQDEKKVDEDEDEEKEEEEVHDKSESSKEEDDSSDEDERTIPLTGPQWDKIGHEDVPRTDVAATIDLERFKFPLTFNSESELASCMRSYEILRVSKLRE